WSISCDFASASFPMCLIFPIPPSLRESSAFYMTRSWGAAPQKCPDRPLGREPSDGTRGRGMRKAKGTRGFARGAIAAALGVVLVLGPAFAAEEGEDEDTFEQKIIKNIMRGLGANIDTPGIDYRERSPLVIPPTRDLPPPEETSAVSNPAWPKDPDVKRATAPKKAQPFENGSIRTHNIEKATLSPDELRKGTLPAGSGDTPKEPTRMDDGGRNLSPTELGYTGGLFGSLFGGAKNEAAPFTAEPPRTS